MFIKDSWILAAVALSSSLTLCACDDDETVRATWDGGTAGSNAGTGFGSGGAAGLGGTATTASASGGHGTGGASNFAQAGAAGTHTNGGASADGSAGTYSVAGQAGSSSGLSVRLLDAEVIHVLETLNAGEIEQAQVATARTQNTAVLAFARRMIEDHTTANSGTRTVASSQQLVPANNQVSTALKTDSDQFLAQLNAVSDTQFDRTYMAGQVMEHQKALTLIDITLSPSAQRAELDTLIRTTRTSVAAHLEEAQTISASLP